MGGHPPVDEACNKTGDSGAKRNVGFTNAGHYELWGLEHNTTSGAVTCHRLFSVLLSAAACLQHWATRLIVRHAGAVMVLTLLAGIVDWGLTTTTTRDCTSSYIIGARCQQLCISPFGFVTHGMGWEVGKCAHV